MQELRDYQMEGSIFGEYVLNLRYYLVDLNQIDEDYILNTNTVIDNIMYCDKFRQKAALTDAVRTAFKRISVLDRQEKEEFINWVKHILLTVCGNNKSFVEEILIWALNGDDDMEFKYNIVRMFEEEREAGKADGIAEGLLIGETIKLISQVRKKMLKELSFDEIADILEEDVSLIERLYELIIQNPEMNDEEIYSELESKTKCV